MPLKFDDTGPLLKMVVGRKKNGGYTSRGIARETNNLVARESNRVTWWGFQVWVLSVVVG